MDAPEPGEPGPAPFPGDGFWKAIESAVTSVGLGSPRTIFKIRKARARWEERREANANIGRGVTYTHKTCPACGRLVERGKASCDYCGANVRWAPGPGLMRWLGLSVPHGSAAMPLLVANLLLYAITTLATMHSTGQNPMSALFAPNIGVLYHMGSLDPAAVLLGQVWRLWTYQFLHFGALHILFNMMALLSLGPTSEDVYGPAKTTVLYWATGVAAGLASLAMRMHSFRSDTGHSVLEFDPHLLVQRLPATVGASGSIFGLIGVLIGHTIRRGGGQGAYMRRFLIQWAVYGLVMGFVIGADNAAHVGGLVSGILLGLLVQDARYTGRAVYAWRIAGFTVLGLILYGFAAAALTRPPAQAPWPGEPDARLVAPAPSDPSVGACATLPPSCPGRSTRLASGGIRSSPRSS